MAQHNKNKKLKVKKKMLSFVGWLAVWLNVERLKHKKVKEIILKAWKYFVLWIYTKIRASETKTKKGEYRLKDLSMNLVFIIFVLSTFCY